MKLLLAFALMAGLCSAALIPVTGTATINRLGSDVFVNLDLTGSYNGHFLDVATTAIMNQAFGSVNIDGRSVSSFGSSFPRIYAEGSYGNGVFYGYALILDMDGGPFPILALRHEFIGYVTNITTGGPQGVTTVYTFVSTPEPSTYGLMGLALAVLGYARLRTSRATFTTFLKKAH